MANPLLGLTTFPAEGFAQLERVRSVVNSITISFFRLILLAGRQGWKLSFDGKAKAIRHHIDLPLTNRFHVAVRLFSNRSQMTSKCRKNKEVAHGPKASVSLLFLPHFDVLCDLLLNRPTATWNLFVLYNDQKRKRPIHIPASNRLTFWGFVLV